MTNTKKGGRSRAISSRRKFIREVMADARKGATSRAASSRAPSVVREIRKNREKPYKREFKKETGKKKKLAFNTTYATAPAGYTFLPLGTPDLAERCKELSRQRSLPVHVVNAQPSSKHAVDPDKVSHYVHRIGYHFKTEVIEEACAELEYVMHGGHFIKEDELRAQHHQNVMAEVMQRHGISMGETNRRETHEQVRAAIKELFPKIPDHDLDEIVARAWKEGTGRVGTNARLDLPRRVQLATIARIRHRYTDYDTLLRSFGWAQARLESEPYCLQKLIEWRGEQDVEDDNELEEIVRETIVIDDDDEDNDDSGVNGSEADDEDSDAAGDTSDTSVKYSHRIAADEDLRPESVHEMSRSFIRRHQPVPRRTELRNNIARQKIGEARLAMRNETSYVNKSNSTSDVLTEARKFMPVHVQVDGRGKVPDQVVVGGQIYHREPPAVLGAAPHSQYPNQQQIPYPTQISTRQLQPSPLAAAPSHSTDLMDRVLPSIEPHKPVSTHEREPYRIIHQPVNPGNIGQLREYDHRSFQDPRPPRPDHFRPFQGHQQWFPARPPRAKEIIDLTTPERESRSGNPSPMRDVQPTSVQYAGLGQYPQEIGAFGGAALHDRPPLMQSQVLESSSRRRYETAIDPVPYDPRQPMLHLSEQERYVPQYSGPYSVTPQPVHGAPAPVQQMPLGRR